MLACRSYQCAVVCSSHSAKCRRPRPSTSTYHSLLSETADLLDRTGSPLLEADTVNLVTSISHALLQSSARYQQGVGDGDARACEHNSQGIAASVIGLLKCPRPQLCWPSLDFTKLNQHTRLWRWIVYSRATTSAMALRPVLPAGFLVFALGAIVCGEVLVCVAVRTSRRSAQRTNCRM